MSRYKFFILILLILGYTIAFSQPINKFTIIGQLADSVSNRPVALASVELWDNSRRTKIKTMFSGKNGGFVLRDIGSGNYRIQVYSVGYRKQEYSISITNNDMEDTTRHITIWMKSDTVTLQNLEVLSRKRLVVQEVDRLVYNVSDDPESKYLSLFEFMRKVPLLSFDAFDHLQLKGESEFRVLIDGRISSLFSGRNLGQVLKSIPAVNILKIEVITIPPAKFGGEGLSGIINIITNKKSTDGYNGNLNGNASPLFSGGSGSLNLKKGKAGATFFGGLTRERNPDVLFENLFSSYSPPAFTQMEKGKRNYTGLTGYSSIVLSVEKDSLHLLTISGGFNHLQSKQASDLATDITYLDSNGKKLFTLNNVQRSSNFDFDAGMNYQVGFKENKKKFLTFSYNYIQSRTNNTNQEFFDNKINYEVTDYAQKNRYSLLEHTFQLDYVNSLKKHGIEKGIKIIQRKGKADPRFYLYHLSGQYVEQNDPEQNNYQYVQHILNAYFSYSLNLKNFTIKIGTRLEYTGITADYATGSAKLDQDYFNFIPSIAFQFKIKKAGYLNGGYTQRIQRPGITFVNPFVDRSNPLFLVTGNPHLQPMLNHRFHLGYNNLGKWQVNVNMSYSFSNNSIQRILSLRDDSVYVSSYENFGKNKNVSGVLSLTAPLTKAISLSVNGQLSYIWLSGVLLLKSLSNSGASGHISSYLSFLLKKNWRGSVSMGYSGSKIVLQGRAANAYLYSGLVLSRSFLDKRFNCSITLTNPFQKYRTSLINMTDESFGQTGTIKTQFRNFNFGLSYQLGKLKERIKTNKRSIQNDDKL